ESATSSRAYEVKKVWHGGCKQPCISGEAPQRAQPAKQETEQENERSDQNLPHRRHRLGRPPGSRFRQRSVRPDRPVGRNGRLTTSLNSAGAEEAPAAKKEDGTSPMNGLIKSSATGEV